MAIFIFIKITKVLVQHWRTDEIKIIMYSDDGVGDLNSVLVDSKKIKSDLIKFGFLLA